MYFRKGFIAILICIFALGSYSPVLAGVDMGARLMVNNRVVLTEISSVNYNGIIMVPAKELAESMGGRFSFDFNTLAGTASVQEKEIVFGLDNSVVSYNGKRIQAAAAMRIIKNRFMVPAEFFAQKFGAYVTYRASNNTMMIFQPVNGKIVYEVAAGDSLWIISRIFGTTITALKEINELTSDTIFIGQKLFVKEMAASLNAINAYTTSSATIRSGAGSSYGVVGYLSASASISVVGKTGSWYKVNTAKGNGYIYYSAVGINQELSAGAQSSWFNNKVPVDTSMNSVSYVDYTILRGDSIWSISQKFGIPESELAAANSISSSATLYPGQKLKIPVHNIPIKPKPGLQYGEILDWFSEAQYIFPIGKTGKLIDIATGKSFYVKRTIGAGHADTETLTTQDSQIMKELFGGSWSWKKRSFILETAGRRFAVSVAGMPHAGVDGVPFLQNTANRSDGFGTGPNYDAIAGNGMNGHFDLYFLNGQRHVDNMIDPIHQYNTLTAGGLK